MATLTSPTVQRQRLAVALRQIRQDNGINGEDAARALRWSHSKLSRFEQAQYGMRPDAVGRLLDYYGVNGYRREHLLTLAGEAQEPPWWARAATGLPATREQYIGFEQGAAAILTWSDSTVPDLLQAPAYAAAVTTGRAQVERLPRPAAERHATLVAARQEHLAGHAQPPQISAIVDEAVLRRQMAGAGVLRNQLDRLTRDAELPWVTVRVVPFTAAPRVPAGPFTIFQFDAGDAPLPDVVAVDHLRGVTFLFDEASAYVYQLAFDALTAAALSPAESRDLILAGAGE